MKVDASVKVVLVGEDDFFLRPPDPQLRFPEKCTNCKRRLLKNRVCEQSCMVARVGHTERYAQHANEAIRRNQSRAK